jgi:hypothetical protein
MLGLPGRPGLDTDVERSDRDQDHSLDFPHQCSDLRSIPLANLQQLLSSVEMSPSWCFFNPSTISGGPPFHQSSLRSAFARAPSRGRNIPIENLMQMQRKTHLGCIPHGWPLVVSTIVFHNPIPERAMEIEGNIRCRRSECWRRFPNFSWPFTPLRSTLAELVPGNYFRCCDSIQ